MAVLQRELSIITSMGRRYSGKIDIPSETFRTTDLLNSSNVYWRNPDDKCYENALMMHEVRLYVDDSAIYKRFEKFR